MPKVSEAHVEARRSQIIEAACRCFSRKGVHQTTIREICEQSGLSAGAVYGYFKSKDEIVEAMAELGRKSTRDYLESMRGTEGPLPSLSRMVSAALGFLQSKQARESTRLDLRLWGEALHTPRIRALFHKAFTSLAEPFAELVREGQRRGEIASHLDPESAARVFAALGLGFTVQRALDPAADLAGCTEVITSLLDGSFHQGRGER